MTPAPFESSEALLAPEEWISVPESSATELLRHLPLAPPPEATGQVEHLLLRKARLRALHACIKEQRVKLRREFARLEASRAELEIERARFVRGRLQATGGTAQPAQMLPVRDAERMNRLFPNPAGAPAVPTPQPSDSEPLPTVAGEHDETSQSVTAYMNRLLGRSQQLRGEAEPHPHAIESACAVSGATQAARDSSWGPTEDAMPVQPGRRRKQVAEEVRAAVGPLRALANQSARAAVKKHSSRKFRQSMVLTLPLMVAAFVLGAVLVRVGGSPGQFSAQAFGTTMLGVITCIALIHSFWMVSHRGPAARLRTRSERAEDDEDGDDEAGDEEGGDEAHPAADDTAE